MEYASHRYYLMWLVSMLTFNDLHWDQFQEYATRCLTFSRHEAKFWTFTNGTKRCALHHNQRI